METILDELGFQRKLQQIHILQVFIYLNKFSIEAFKLSKKMSNIQCLNNILHTYLMESSFMNYLLLQYSNFLCYNNHFQECIQTVTYSTQLLWVQRNRVLKQVNTKLNITSLFQKFPKFCIVNYQSKLNFLWL